MKKTTLLGFSMIMMLPLFASASLTQKTITVVSGQCVSADQKFTAEIEGTRILQRNLIFFPGKVLADVLRIQLKEVATGEGVGLHAVDGQSDNLAFALSDDGTHLNINAFYKGVAVEIDLTCKSEINERGMLSFIKQSR